MVLPTFYKTMLLRSKTGDHMPRPIIYAIVTLLLLAGLLRLFNSPDALASLVDFGTSIARPIFIPLVILISQPSFVYVASFVIILSALVIIALHLGGTVRRELKAFKNAQYMVEHLPGIAPENWHLATAEINPIISKYNVMFSAWTSYIQEANQSGHLPARRFALFAEADPWNPVNRRGSVVESLPSYYTTIGLILTFVGLVVALYFAAKGFQSGDMAVARSAIVQLLDASAFKFLTSVAALIGALMISVAHRAGQWWLRIAVHAFGTAVDLRLQNAQTASAIGSASQNSQTIEIKQFDQLTLELKSTRSALEALTISINAQRNGGE